MVRTRRSLVLLLGHAMLRILGLGIIGCLCSGLGTEIEWRGKGCCAPCILVEMEIALS